VCGIAGMVLRPGKAVDETVLEKMTSALRHRGPDAGGLFRDGPVGLGHRRLSIIDTSSAANQPLFNEDGSVVVVFNGEIYNFQELVEELTARGHRFRTRSDTEVIVHAWEEYGAGCLARFRGMFAFALHDRNQGRLFLARDPFGKKPLFYAASPHGLAFASEIKSLRTLPGFDAALDLAALGEYTAYGHSLGERTIFRDVRKLPPAHYLLLDTRAAEARPEVLRYWDLRPRPDPVPSQEEWLDEMDRVLSEAVRLRMISDVPLGAFLSGGIDSSLVVAYMVKHSTAPVKTFTIGFREPSHDESQHARAVARHLGTEHHVEYVTPNAVEVLPRLVEAYDEPFADPSALPTWYLSQMTRRHVTVALSGDGGDELFLGYDRYAWCYGIERAARLMTGAGRRLARVAARAVPAGTRGKGLLRRLAAPGFDAYNDFMGYCDASLSFLRPDVRRVLPPAGAGKMASDFRRLDELPIPERYQYLDLFNYLPEDILVKVDRASMAHSLEVRCPILDAEFAELAARIPLGMKFSRWQGKRILKRLAYRHVPRAILDRPKMGFGVPLGRWFQGELEVALRDMVADAGSPTWQYFDRDVTARRVREHVEHQVDWGLGLWRLLFFHAWSRSHAA